MWKHHECYLPLTIFSSWVFGFGPPQACILSLRTIRWQHTNPFWTPDPDKVTLMSWRSDGGCCHSRARADSPTHSRLTGIGYEALPESIPQGSFWVWAQPMMLHCNVISHWLSPYPERSLFLCGDIHISPCLLWYMWIIENIIADGK